MIRRVFLGDLGARPGRYLRDLLVLVGLGAVGALIAIGVHQLRLRAGHRMQALPALGSPIRQPLAALGVDASAMSTPYGVVVFLDKEWAQSIPLLAGALDSLSNRGFTVYVAAPAAPSAQEPPLEERGLSWSARPHRAGIWGFFLTRVAS
ncbi:MAG: hypothetical protein ONB30_13280 [candidate division KSB1 bacterium]|nr:hypothetical protein [candidate division KSB1 bacterium]